MTEQGVLDVYRELGEWKELAGIRQGIINKLEKKLARLEGANDELRAALLAFAPKDAS